MHGISSKAAGGVDNKKKYNGIEFENDLEINTYDAFFRELDPQTGRWWQIDPVTDGYESISPYASMYDNPITIMDPLGNEGEVCCDELVNAVVKSVRQVVLTTGGLLNGTLNGATAGLYPTRPLGDVGMDAEVEEWYDGAVKVGQTLGLALNPMNAFPMGKLVPLGGPARVVPLAPVLVPTSNKANSASNSSSGGTRSKHKTTPDKGGPANGKLSNKPGTTVKKYNKDGSVVKEWNKGHPDHDKNSKNYKDHVHDYKTPGEKKSRQPARAPKRNEKLKDV
jgi:RHS repeat-associated protein